MTATATTTNSPGVTKEARYILTSIENNNNKFWSIRLFSDGTCETHWGRVGEDGQRKKAPGGSEAFFQSKCREKETKGYKAQRTLNNDAGGATVEAGKLAEVAQSQIETNSPETLALVTYLARVNVHAILQTTTMQYDTSKGTFSTPLGIVTADAINEARTLLTDMGSFVAKADWSNTCFVNKLNDYLMLVPQNIGRGRPDPKVLYPDLEAIQKQNNILDSLEASLQSVVTAAEGEPRPAPKLFEARLDLVSDARVIERIRAKYRETQQTMHACHHLDVKRVFTMEVASMRRAYEQGGASVGNVRELWHGTRASNLLSLLKSGFYIAPRNAPYVTGRMFGNGVYFSDQSTKALNYAFGYWGGQSDNNCFMLLNDVAMGREFTPSGPSQSLPMAGYDSAFAKANVSGVANNEMIVYNLNQINPKYLVEFSPQGK